LDDAIAGGVEHLLGMPRDWGLVADLKQLLKGLDDEHDGDQGGKGLFREARDQRHQCGGVKDDEEEEKKCLPSKSIIINCVF
jgi:hypothetical protein